MLFTCTVLPMAIASPNSASGSELEAAKAGKAKALEAIKNPNLAAKGSSHPLHANLLSNIEATD